MNLKSYKKDLKPELHAFLSNNKILLFVSMVNKKIKIFHQNDTKMDFKKIGAEDFSYLMGILHNDGIHFLRIFFLDTAYYT